jgi:ankyrin repeat protein
VSKIDERDSYGFTALHLAADRGEFPSSQLRWIELIETFAGNIEIVHLLIDAGADPSLQVRLI